MKELNLNSLVEIPATSSVLEYLRYEHNEYWQNYAEQFAESLTVASFVEKRIAEYSDPVVKNGRIRLPLWDVMNKFGASMSPGFSPLFVTILIDEKDLK
ncbi:hypothetical protein PJM41_0049 [Salmonella phage vB_SenS_UTK0009]|uniref:Uncharacterized protein n=1 Tax=Salmonella phage vB_SenS_UTK0009 TaxID=3028908 RepID=A0AAE9ZKA5_9CAUD|nr:hypothetical protein PJM41_0049 [Salmonella phage vB_SenS_UTK0009]